MTQMGTEGRPCEDIGKRQPSASQGVRPQKEINPTDTLVLDIQSLELRENKFLWFKPPGLWYFVMAALAN